MRFEVGQIWHNGADRTVQAKVIAVTDDGLHATLRRITHGLGTFQLDVSAIVAGLQKWQLTVHPRSSAARECRSSN
jgi:hypothetical protein